MDLHLDDRHLRFPEEIRSWLAANLRRPWREEVRDPGADENGLIELRRAWQRKLNDAGYLGVDWPKEWGGRGGLDLHFFFKRAKTLESLYGSTEFQLERALAAVGL